MKGVTHWERRGFVTPVEQDWSSVVGDLPLVDNRRDDPEELAAFLAELPQLSATCCAGLREPTSAARQPKAAGRPERSSPLITGPVKGF